jgi:hypothetical protein
MARCRNLKPAFFKNEQLGALPEWVRILFAGLWCWSDREGRLEDRPMRLKAEILPYDSHDINDGLDQLSRGDDPFIVRYQVGGDRYIQVVKFPDHQSPHYTEKPSVIPAPPLDSGSTPKVLQPPIKGIEAQGSEVNRKGSREGKPKRKQILANGVPVPDGFETPAVRQAIADWIGYKANRGEPYKDAGYFGRKVAEYASAGPGAFIAAVNFSIGNNYAGLFPAKDPTNGNRNTTRHGAERPSASQPGSLKVR